MAPDDGRSAIIWSPYTFHSDKSRLGVPNRLRRLHVVFDRRLGTSYQTDRHRHDKKYDGNPKQDACAFHSRARYTAETKERGDERNDEKYDCVVE